MPKPLTVPEILARCATIDARLSGVSTFFLSICEYPEGQAPGFPLGQIAYTRGSGSKVVHVGEGYSLALSVRFLPSTVGPLGATYYALGSGWVLRVDPGDEGERLTGDDVAVCADD